MGATGVRHRRPHAHPSRVERRAARTRLPASLLQLRRRQAAKATAAAPLRPRPRSTNADYDQSEFGSAAAIATDDVTPINDLWRLRHVATTRRSERSGESSA